MKTCWVVVQWVDSSEGVVSIHRTKVGADKKCAELNKNKTCDDVEYSIQEHYICE